MKERHISRVLKNVAVYAESLHDKQKFFRRKLNKQNGSDSEILKVIKFAGIVMSPINQIKAENSLK